MLLEMRLAGTYTPTSFPSRVKVTAWGVPPTGLARTVTGAGRGGPPHPPHVWSAASEDTSLPGTIPAPNGPARTLTLIDCEVAQRART